MKKSIYLHFSFAALLFAVSVQNDLLAGSIAILKFDAVNQTDPSRGTPINTTRSNIKSLSLALDDLDKILKNQSVRGTPLNRSKSNLNSLSVSLDNLDSGNPMKRVTASASVKKANEALDKSIMDLHNSIVKRYPKNAAEIKAKHDAVKNSINNIK